MIRISTWRRLVVIHIPVYARSWGEPTLGGPFHVWADHVWSGGPKV